MQTDLTREEVLDLLDKRAPTDALCREAARLIREGRDAVPREVALAACAYSSMICSRRFAFNDERPAVESIESVKEAMRERGETVLEIVNDPVIGEDFTAALAAAEKEAKP